MAEPDILAIADAVVDALNEGPDEGEFSIPFVAVRKALPLLKLEEMGDGLHVTVVPRSVTSSMLDRATDEHDVGVDVAIQQHFEPQVDVQDIDDQVALVAEIRAFLNRKAMAGASWVGTQSNPIYSPDHLREMRVFTSVLKLSYKVLE